MRAIDELIWQALTDSAFCEQLLNGHRRDILAASSLTEIERQDVLAVEADTLAAFAGVLCRSGSVGEWGGGIA